jgi:hypothetical protein
MAICANDLYVADAATAVRRLSDRPPLPAPTWQQSADLDKIVPSNMDQATGLERAEVLGEMAGKKVFEDKVRFMVPCVCIQGT